MVWEFGFELTAVTTAVHDEDWPDPIEVPDVVPTPGVVRTATVVPGARSGGNWPSFNPTAAMALPWAGICGEPSSDRVSREPAGKLYAIGRPTTVEADEAGTTSIPESTATLTCLRS